VATEHFSIQSFVREVKRSFQKRDNKGTAEHGLPVQLVSVNVMDSGNERWKPLVLFTNLSVSVHNNAHFK